MNAIPQSQQRSSSSINQQQPLPQAPYWPKSRGAAPSDPVSEFEARQDSDDPVGDSYLQSHNGQPIQPISPPPKRQSKPTSAPAPTTVAPPKSNLNQFAPRPSPFTFAQQSTPRPEDPKLGEDVPEHERHQPVTVAKPSLPSRVPEWKNYVKNDWAMTVKDPVNVHGVQVPDYNTQPSGVLAVRQFTTVTPTNGCFGVALGSFLGSSTGTSLVTRAFPNGFANNGTAPFCLGVITGSGALHGSTDAPFDDTAGATGVNPVPLAAGQVLADSSVGVRLVSAALTVWPICNFNNNQGMSFGTSLPKNFFRSKLLETYTETEIEDLPGITPLMISDGGMTIVWKPTDIISTQYKDPDLSQNDAANSNFDDGTLIYYASGLSTAAPYCPFYVQIDLNYELLPGVGSFAIGLSSSFVDSEAFDEALNEIQSVPPAFKAKTPRPTDIPNGYMSHTNSSHLMFGTTSNQTGRMLVTTTRSGGKAPVQRERKTMFEQLAELALSTAKMVAPSLLNLLK